MGVGGEVVSLDGGSGSGEVLDLVSLYRTWRLPLTRLAYLLVGNLPEAEDAVHDAFVGLHTRREPLRVPGAEAAYLRAGVVNACRSLLRRRGTARRYAPPVTHEPGADEAVLIADEQRAVLVALADLPERQREVLVLRFWSGLSEREIAQAMGVSQGTVKSTASRALARLARDLEEGR